MEIWFQLSKFHQYANGEFTLEIKTGGPLWFEDGVYTITANQGIASEFEDSVEVEIVQGKVIPEFGTIAAMILGISIISIIAITAKSKLKFDAKTLGSPKIRK